MSQLRRVNALREAVAQSLGKRPTWVKLSYVRTIQGYRIDIEFQWVNEPHPRCVVHTRETSARKAIAAVMAVASLVEPGVRFSAHFPESREVYRR